MDADHQFIITSPDSPLIMLSHVGNKVFEPFLKMAIFVPTLRLLI